MTRRVFAAIAFALVAMALPASAQAGWSTAQSVSGLGTNTSQTRIAGGTDGSSWVVWKRDLGGFAVIQAAKVSPDGTAGPVASLSPLTMQSTDPVIQARADGSAIVGWINESGAASFVQTASLGADGTIGVATNRSDSLPVGEDAQDVAVAVNADGTAGVTWRRNSGGNWYVQAVKVAANGASGTVHTLSDPAKGSTSPPAIASSAANAYRVAWPQGTGDTANIYSNEIKVDDTLDTQYQVLWPNNPGTGGDPQDVKLVYGTDGLMTMAWVRTRTDTGTDGTPIVSRAVEQARTSSPGALLLNTAPLPVTSLTPAVAGTTASDVRMVAPPGGQPGTMWKRDLGGGVSNFETARYLNNGSTVGWSSAGLGEVGAVNPSFAMNKNSVGIIGWENPATSTSSWTRFSNTAFVGPYTPAGFDDVTDPGFAVADSGVTLAAFTGTTAGLASSMVSVFTDPQISTSPALLRFGRVNAGFSAGSVISLRSTGQTAGQVTGVTVTGPDASEFLVTNVSDCVRAIDAGSACNLKMKFSPSSTGDKSATVTVISPSGDQVTQLTGTGGSGTRLSARATPRSKGVRRGKVVQVKLTVKNLGVLPAKNVRVCAQLNRRVLKMGGNRCRKLGNMAGQATRNLSYRVRVTGRAKRKTVYPVVYRVRSNNAVQRLAKVKLRRKGR